MATLKTQPTGITPEEFLATVEPPRRRAEGEAVLALVREVTGDGGAMWGPSIVGFGTYHFRYASGREGDWMKLGFSPRKAQFVLYGLIDSPTAVPLLDRLGPHTTGKGCVYVKDVAALDDAVLRELVALAFARGDYDAKSEA